jgi:aerobic carbon-monoxide dehydrogenase large subunit
MSQDEASHRPAVSGSQGIGASLRRNEDARYLDGKGEYLADLQVPGMAEAVFLRSPVAHGKIRSITVPEAAEGQVSLRPTLPSLSRLSPSARPKASSLQTTRR